MKVSLDEAAEALEEMRHHKDYREPAVPAARRDRRATPDKELAPATPKACADVLAKRVLINPQARPWAQEWRVRGVRCSKPVDADGRHEGKHYGQGEEW